MYTIDSDYYFERILTNGVHLNTLIAGNPDNPLIILLHGFPEFHITWIGQVDILVNAGYYVFVPDQRGYNLSDKPKEREAYLVKEIGADVLGLIQFAQKEKAVIAGHDWGGIIAYYLSMNFPERFDQVIIINSCVIKTLQLTLYKSHRQRWRSFYIFLFLNKKLTINILSRWNNKVLWYLFLGNSLKGTFSEELRQKYRTAWAQQGAIESMTEWYRAGYPDKNKNCSIPINIPLLIIWGKKDAFFINQLAEKSAAYASDSRIEYIEAGTHWILHEFPEKVGALMTQFLEAKRVQKND